jgi:hypothetical protein
MGDLPLTLLNSSRLILGHDVVSVEWIMHDLRRFRVESNESFLARNESTKTGGRESIESLISLERWVSGTLNHLGANEIGRFRADWLRCNGPVKFINGSAPCEGIASRRGQEK